MPQPDTRQADIISIAQTLIRAVQKVETVTPDLIAAKVDIASGIVAPEGLNATARDEAISELIRRCSIWIGKDLSLEDNTGHEKWLDFARKKGWLYWPRYQTLLGRNLPDKGIEALDESTDKILSLLEDPLRSGSWDRRGLVVGHVQSGKTSNYSGLICKAADAGYKIIIVLAGLHNNLRAQTQIRLEESFLGYETSASNSPGHPVGVGLIDTDLAIRPHCATNRSDKGDFNKRAARHLAISPEQRPWLFVVKKHKGILDLLIAWIEGRVADTTDVSTGRKIVSGMPLLLIDDEADHASVDTGELLLNDDDSPVEDYQPKAINSRIRRILNAFSKSAYVGFTATPFANIFIHRRAATVSEGHDLFPQSFIINLPAPSDYMGPARVFGLKTPAGRDGGLPLIRLFDDHTSVDGHDGWMPPRHKTSHVPSYHGSDDVPDSLREAILAFVLACAAKTCRGMEKQHSSMLIHVTRYTLVQKEVHRQVSETVRRIKQRIMWGTDNTELLGELRLLWERDFIPTSSLMIGRTHEFGSIPGNSSWNDILAALPDSIADIQVKMVNGTAKDALDYVEHDSKGLKVIAIGGEKLARGLTLEGLCVSYFVRTTKMYDTLMQMGRWFGYRPGYADLCRLYTTEELVEWFGHITDASEELREEFEAMVERGASPAEYGLRVQSHPVLLVTSPLKMRTARSLQLSFSGELLETVSLHNDDSTLDRNLDLVEKFVASMDQPSEVDSIVRKRRDTEHRWSGFLWNRISADAVAQFLDAYVTHPKARKVNAKLLADFVRSMAACGELNSWAVALLGGGDGEAYKFQCGITIDRMIARKSDPDIKDRYSIGRLLSPRDEAIDLDEPSWLAAMELTRRMWKPDAGRQKDGSKPNPPESPNGPAIRHIRGLGSENVPAAPERGLLLLYPLDPKKAGGAVFSGRTRPVMAMGISFPSSVSGVKVEYRVDHLLWESEYGAAD